MLFRTERSGERNLRRCPARSVSSDSSVCSGYLHGSGLRCAECLRSDQFITACTPHTRLMTLARSDISRRRCDAVVPYSSSRSSTTPLYQEILVLRSLPKLRASYHTAGVMASAVARRVAAHLSAASASRGGYRKFDLRPSMSLCTSSSTVRPSAFSCCAFLRAGAISDGAVTIMPTAPKPSAILA